MVLEKLGTHGGEKKNLNLNLSYCTKINAKWIRNLNAK